MDARILPRRGRPLRILDAVGVEIWRCVAGRWSVRLRCDLRPTRAHPEGDYILVLPGSSSRERGETIPIHLDGREVLLIISHDGSDLGIERVRELDVVGEARRVDLGTGGNDVIVSTDVPAGRFCAWGGWMQGVDVWREGRWWTYRRGRDCQCGRCGEIHELAADDWRFVTTPDGLNSWYRMDLELRPADPRTGCDAPAALELRVEQVTTPTMTATIVDTWVVRATFRPADLPLAPSPP